MKNFGSSKISCTRFTLCGLNRLPGGQSRSRMKLGGGGGGGCGDGGSSSSLSEDRLSPRRRSSTMISRRRIRLSSDSRQKRRCFLRSSSRSKWASRYFWLIRRHSLTILVTLATHKARAASYDVSAGMTMPRPGSGAAALSLAARLTVLPAWDFLGMMLVTIRRRTPCVSKRRLRNHKKGMGGVLERTFARSSGCKACPDAVKSLLRFFELVPPARRLSESDRHLCDSPAAAWRPALVDRFNKRHG